MTCDQAVGLRESGCWGRLILLGDAPMTRGTGRAEGVIPETRPAYGGANSEDSSGVLRYVRVAFAGVNFNPETQPNAFGFHGVGSGTIIDHIQAHEGEDDGIEFFGGSAKCTSCVSSGAKDDSLDWACGSTGTAQYVYIHQDPDGDNGIEADNDSSGFDRTPRSSPKNYNMTMVGGLEADLFSAHGGDGMCLRRGTQVTVRNLVMIGFGGEALDVRDNSPSFFMSGDSRIKSAIITGNAGMTGDSQFSTGIATHIGYADVAPVLTNVRFEGNPDPRPRKGFPALAADAGTSPLPTAHWTQALTLAGHSEVSTGWKSGHSSAAKRITTRPNRPHQQTSPSRGGPSPLLQGARGSNGHAAQRENYISRKAISSRTREATLRPCWRAGRNRHCRTASTAFLSSPRPRCRRTSMFLA